MNLFIPSVLTNKELGMELAQYSHMPESDKVEFRLNLQDERTLTLRIRRPDWAKIRFLLSMGKKKQLIRMPQVTGYWTKSGKRKTGLF